LLDSTRLRNTLAPHPPDRADPAGRGADIAARVLGQKLSEQMGEPVVSRTASAQRHIATELVARAAPDGYTLGLVADSQIAINPHLYSKMSFDTLRDLTPVSSVASNQFVLAVNPSLPGEELPEFIEYARKANPRSATLPAATAASTTSPWKCSKSGPASTWCTCLSRRAPATTAAVAGEARDVAGSSNAAQIKPADCARWRYPAASARRNIPSCDDQRVLPWIREQHLARSVRPCSVA